MFGNIYKSIINTSNFLWEPVGIVFAFALAWCIWRWRKNLRDPLPWCAACGILFAIVWRQCFHVTSGRYHGIFIVPVLFLCFFAMWDIFGGKIKYWLLAAACTACLMRDLHHNPAEREMAELYRRVRADAGNYARSTGQSYTRHTLQERFYTGVETMDIDRAVAPEVVLRQLDGNFSVWDGDWDAVYIFLALPRGTDIPPSWLANNRRTGKLDVFARAWYDRRHKKQLAVLKYLPGAKRDDECRGELLPNGDFRQILDGEKHRMSTERLGRRAPRFLQPGIMLPQEWGIYHSLTSRSLALATVVKRSGRSVLRLEADSYLGVFSPEFVVTSARKLNFKVHAETPATLQITRTVKFQAGGDMYPILTLALRPGSMRYYTVTLPPFAGSVKDGFWFWLHSGTVELTDIRLQ